MPYKNLETYNDMHKGVEICKMHTVDRLAKLSMLCKFCDFCHHQLKHSHCSFHVVDKSLTISSLSSVTSDNRLLNLANEHSYYGV